jgi:hypothetical protein
VIPPAKALDSATEHFRAKVALAMHALRAGFTERAVMERIPFGAPGTWRTLSKSEAKEIAQRAFREAFAEWRADAQ